MRSAKRGVFFLVTLLAVATGVGSAQSALYRYNVINTYPHDRNAFTQGLVLLDGKLYESTGLYGSSTLREVDLTSGTVLRSVAVPSQFFAEGMTVFQGKIFQLTWQSQTGFIYDPGTFNLLGQFSYTGEGWGLTHDAQHLIMSDGTDQIRFLDPVTFQVVNAIHVRDDQGRPVTKVNELEYIGGEIYANIWQTNWIARIDPVTGGVVAWIDLTGLLPAGTQADVLNGIAYDGASGHLLVTGKFWPSLFAITLSNAPPTVSLTSPTSGATFAAPASVTLSADATDTDGAVASVTFYVNGASVGRATASPYSCSWANVGAGSYSIMAVAADNSGNVGVAPSVTITVASPPTPPANGPPTVSLTSPAPNATFNAPATLTLLAAASDDDGTVSSVAFYANGVMLGRDTSAPYSLPWSNVMGGAYTLTAVATDNLGATKTSSPVSITVRGKKK